MFNFIVEANNLHVISSRLNIYFSLVAKLFESKSNKLINYLF